MGLAAAKNKRRLGTDPNNTRWSRNTDTFGQKILRAQGWQPGQFLGAKDAAHSHLHTDASASHIRVVLKEDNLGLGAKRNNGDECVGLDAFQHLLGRLNGKSEEVLESERVAREGVKLTLYADRKWGPMRFVSGGLLVGDEIKEVPDVKPEASKKRSATPEALKSKEVEMEAKQDSTVTNPSDIPQETKVKKSKKRKVDEDSEAKDSKKDKRSKRRKTVEDARASSDDKVPAERKKEKSRKSKGSNADGQDEGTSSKARKKRRADKEESLKEDTSTPSGSSDDVDASTTSKSRKLGKGKKDKEKKKRKGKKSLDGELGDSSEKSSKKKRKGKEEQEDEASTEESATVNLTPSNSGLSTPVLSGYSTPELGTSARHLARKRFIAQKRMAFSDPKALSQIFMIKS
ncbi:hypothetical protein GQ53DRAFT_823303 [Thozetella sp. PMI_491]|nr:hypothetical protein GQ53DRAFT_823303 [Thozetella sp. PMI_491]